MLFTFLDFSFEIELSVAQYNLIFKLTIRYGKVNFCFISINNTVFLCREGTYQEMFLKNTARRGAVLYFHIILELLKESLRKLMQCDFFGSF